MEQDRHRKEQKAKQNQHSFDTLIRSFSGKVGPSDLPLPNKNYLVLPEQELSVVAKLMRLRISDDALYINPEKTVAKAIRNAGFLEPVLLARSRQSEFLVLIDEKNTNSQQVKLFEFLIDLLRKQNVYINSYYYRSEPALCFDSDEANGISLEKLSEKFPDNILLIFGDAYQLVYSYYPIIDQDYLQLLNRWKYKAVITPVPFLDWGNKEKKVLLAELPVFPADIPGLLLLMTKLFRDEINILSELQQFSSDFYDTEIVDFEDIDELHEYFSVAAWANAPGNYANLLFQWIAALAVYPKIKWELTVAIGKAILDKHGYPQELNFTNLLRIARITWMQAGQCPEFTRLALLKLLTVDNEITARETILAVLNEIPETELGKDHFAFEEKEMQRIINEFSLYAYNPEKYGLYKGSVDLFAQLDSNNLVMDNTAKAYLENPSLQWQTIINKPRDEAGSAGEAPENVPLPDFLTANSEPVDRSRILLYLRAGAFSLIFCLVAVAFLVGLYKINAAGSNNSFTYRSSLGSNIMFTFTDTVNKRPATIQLTVDTSEISIARSDASPLLLDISDTPKKVTIKKSGILIFDTTLIINRNAYTIALVPNSSATDTKTKTVRPNLTKGYWIMQNATDATNTDWSNSGIKFESQKDTIGGLILTGNFTWINMTGIVGQENFSGFYSDENRSINVIGSSISKITGSNKNPLALGRYSAVLAQDENSLSLGTVESADAQPVAQFIKKWTAIRTTSNPVDAIKPIVYIEISDTSLQENANAFKRTLENKGFTVPPVERSFKDSNSDIYYYSDAMQKPAAAIQQIYNDYFPALNVKAHKKEPGKEAVNPRAIVIWIKLLEKNNYKY